MVWLWYAYKKGAFPDWPRNLEAAAFEELTLARMKLHGEVRALMAPHKLARDRGERDALVGLAFSSPARQGFPTFTWMPWATDRNKVEASVAYLERLRRDRIAYFASRALDDRFYTLLRAYGLMRRVGTLFDYFERGREAGFYETRLKEI